MNSVNLVERFQLYSSWRFALGQAVTRLRDWLRENESGDSSAEARLTRVLDRLSEDRLSIAFVAEFSRGKSELINAIFFADYGRRILPSSAGRTTMCPTELMYDPAQPAQIRLLPIETRAGGASVAELKSHDAQWRTHPLDTGSADAMLEAFRQVSETRRVRVSAARQLALFDEKDPDARTAVSPDGTIEIPAWRHAIINFPHPLLAQGLVILDTPGLNAIGTEPELTLNLIPNAHAVLFILAADTGVTKSDIAVWREHIGNSGSARGRIAVLNKIDSMWDELKTEAEVEAEIARQVTQVAATLSLPESHVFPISAQKGLVAKVQDEPDLLVKSRLPRLETALSQELIPAKQEIVREFVAEETRDIIGAAQALYATRVAAAKEQLAELDGVKDKNRGVLGGMLERVRVEKSAFERGLMQFSAIRSVLTRNSNALFEHLGADAFDRRVADSLKAVGGANFSAGMIDGMRSFFVANREQFVIADRIVAEITDMMAAMYQRFSEDFKLKLSMPRAFSMGRYLKELDRVEDSFNRRFGTLSLITQYERTLTRRFFDVVAARIRLAFEIANRDSEGWLKAVMNPLEAQIRERQQGLKKRVESIQRINEAAGTLAERIEELSELTHTLTTKVVALDNLRLEIDAMLNQDMVEADTGGAGFDVSL
jgi:hypothetical protein